MKRKRINAPEVEWMGSLPQQQEHAQAKEINEEQEMAYEMQELMLGAESDSDEETEDTLHVNQYNSDEERDDEMSDEEEE